MRVNAGAPVLVRREIEIFAPPEQVWEWLSRVELWPDWHHDISSCQWLEGNGMNATFKWRIRKIIGLTSRIESWRELREIGWVSHVWRTTARHIFRIDGDFRATRVVVEASLEGGALGARMLRSLVRQRLATINETWLAALKTRIEAEKPTI